jgi:hypothetical protein
MSKVATATTFTPCERDYVRRELDMFFSTYPTVAEGATYRPQMMGWTPPDGIYVPRWRYRTVT